MIGFNTDETANGATQEEPESSNSDEEEVLIYKEINKLTFKDENTPNLINYKNSDHDKLVRKYLGLYKDCAPGRNIVERLNMILSKADVDKFDQDACVVSEGLMTFFINYLINYQRLVKTDDPIDLLTYFLVYSAKDVIPQKSQIYNPLMTNIQQYQYAHLNLLQPSIEEFKHKIKLNQFAEYKYLALIINGNSKWFMCLFDLKFKEAYHFDQAYDPKSDIKQYDKFFEDLVYEELRFDVKKQVIHGLLANINDPSDCGHLMFYTLYKLLQTRKQIEVNSDFLVPTDIKRAKTRCMWLILVQMNMERDKKEDRRELKRSQKKYMSLLDKQKELDKIARGKKNELRLKLREELLFNRMLQIPSQLEPQVEEEDLEQIRYQILVKKLAVFNHKPKPIIPISQEESKLYAKKPSQPDHIYNFYPQRPIDTRAKIRDLRAQVQHDQFYYFPGYKAPIQRRNFPITQIPHPQSMQVSQISHPQSMQISIDLQYQKGSKNNSQDMQYQNSLNHYNLQPIQPQNGHHNYNSQDLQPQQDEINYNSLNMQNSKGPRNFNSQVVKQNYYTKPFKPSSKDLQKRWHYAQNLKKLQPTQQSLGSLLKSGRNLILPYFSYPSV